MGHNGAGKTTTINMVSGLTKISKGGITLHTETGDLSVRDDLNEVRL